MNISILFIAAAFCSFTLSLWSVKVRNRKGVAINVVFCFILALAAFVIHPIYSVSVAENDAAIKRIEIGLESERLEVLNGILGGTENTLKYIEYTKKQ